MNEIRVLELYSGIGGMHLALKESGVKGNVICSIDINQIANKIYAHNFPNTKLLNANIQGLTSEKINKLNINTILMSPPCQPFTRNGLQNDINDPRTKSFLHILELLPELNVTNILIENVKGFEMSKVRDVLVECLKKNVYDYQEFILSPHQFGIPNTRHRYYCLAKRWPQKFCFETKPMIMYHLNNTSDTNDCYSLSRVVENTIAEEKYLLADKILSKRANILDICYPNSKRSCCFTKNYARFIEGTGSIFTNKTPDEVSVVYNTIKDMKEDSQERLELLKSLKMRFFTPKEVSRLMCFPEDYEFPQDVTDKSRYQVLGNSINVKVVAELIKILCK